MKRKIFRLAAALIAVMLIAGGCALDSPGSTDGSGGGKAPDQPGYEYGDTSDTLGDGGSTPQQRKLIYNVSFTLKSDDVNASAEAVKAALADDEWFDSFSISDRAASFGARIKTERIDEFVDAVRAGGEISDYYGNATDISLEYYDIENIMNALQAEHDRLEELLGEAKTVSDTLTISSRLAQIEANLARYQQNLNSYDSLVEYSQIHINVSLNVPAAEPMPFGRRVALVFVGAWKALLTFCKWLLLAFLAVLPFAAVLAPVAAVAVIITKKRQKRKALAAAPKADAETPTNADNAPPKG
jgi:hypothetical protein